MVFTGTGGEIRRDRMGGGRGSWPIAGTAVYMTYPRTEEGREWEEILPVRKWLYQTRTDSNQSIQWCFRLSVMFG